MTKDTYYTYDAYGNQTSQSVYDTDTATKPKLYSSTEYTGDGNFVASSKDNMGNETEYEYNSLTGQMSKTRLPVRDTGADQTSVSYSYDGKQRMTGVSQGTTGNTRGVGYTYGDFRYF